jgi:ribonucleoside-diphosphate reductase alpha chain
MLNHPLKEQQEVSRTYRNIGIGIMGLADCLVKLKLKYGSDKAVDFTRKLINFIFRNAVYASVQLGLQRGNFPGYTSKVWNSNIIKNNFTDEEIEELKKTDHLRNCSLLSIAPTGLK